jgi:hypothetical protein
LGFGYYDRHLRGETGTQGPVNPPSHQVV